MSPAERLQSLFAALAALAGLAAQACWGPSARRPSTWYCPPCW
ncbi:hypothetical protein HNR06_004718 [Nocardiopsis arvandica]|uniref:Uncharacterized protein n=1 Tax=Nocardiopsis sinuspersici TaxID=501010 RepID=A0A7Z0BN49_9ACTN|nr:hypothetical protein [Nocardiopsis sinuspersici]NYH55129.1 hypothetical protein [Nocardiopsis sinuspersici]